MAITGEPTRRLIEEWLPINEISIEAIRERAGAVPNPAPHQLHVWWAHPEILRRLAQMTPLCRRQSIQSQYAAYNRDCPDQTDSSNHVTLWDGSNYKRAA